MSKRSMNVSTRTPTATADTTDLVDATYMGALKGANSTQTTNILEIVLTGQAPSTSSPCIMLLSRDSQVATGANTFTAGVSMDVPLHPATAALAAPVLSGDNWATLKPRRDTAAHLLNCSVNAYGGIYKWTVTYPGEEITIVGNTASFGEVSLSAMTGGTPGLLGSHIIFETL